MTILETATTDTSTASLVRIYLKAVSKIMFGVKNRTSNKKLENKNIITSKQKYYNQNLFFKMKKTRPVKNWLKKNIKCVKIHLKVLKEYFFLFFRKIFE